MQGVNNIKDPEKIILKERSALISDIINFKYYMALVVNDSNSRVKHRWNNTGMRCITRFRSTTDRIYVGGPIILYDSIIIYYNTLCYNCLQYSVQ
jgi:hypothetical protein